MVLAIVGPDARAWTKEGERLARLRIHEELIRGLHESVHFEAVSGACHLGGVDIWAYQEAEKMNISFREFPPKGHSWYWYRQRNQRIAHAAQRIVCITPAKGWCKHCYAEHHGSGGCWTLQYAKKIGKDTEVIVID